jgi:hypothetical protein
MYAMDAHFEKSRRGLTAALRLGAPSLALPSGILLLLSCP